MRAAPWKVRRTLKIYFSGDLEAAQHQFLPGVLRRVGEAEEIEILGTDHAASRRNARKLIAAFQNFES